MKRSLFLIGLCLFCNQCFSWNLSGVASARSNAMGNCSVACMSDYTFFGIRLSYENRFFMKELSLYNSAIVVPMKIGIFGLSYDRFGFENYNENKLGLGYARSFGPYLKMGLKLDYLWFKFSNDYEKRRTATFELGIQSEITKDLCVGAYIFNPINIKLQTIHNERIPVVFRFGMSYKVTKDFLATTEVEYNTESKLDYRFGLEYNALKEFYIRVGVHTNPATASFGVGYTINRVIIDVSATINQYTGVSFQSSLIFKIKEAGL